MTTAVFWFSFIAFFVSLFRSFVLFDRILRCEYDGHPDAWTADGRPAGYFWIPEGTSPSLEGYRIRYRLYARLFMRTPAWVETGAEHVMLRSFRLWWAVVPLSGLIALTLFFVSFAQHI